MTYLLLLGLIALFVAVCITLTEKPRDDETRWLRFTPKPIDRLGK